MLKKYLLESFVALMLGFVLGFGVYDYTDTETLQNDEITIQEDFTDSGVGCIDYCAGGNDEI